MPKRNLIQFAVALLLILVACQPAVNQVPRPTLTPFQIFHFVLPTATQASSTPAPTSTLAPIATATQSNLPDLRGQTISLGFLCDKTSPLAELDASRIAGVQDMVAYINGNDGIFGAQLVLQFGDTQGTVDGAQRAEARLMREFGDLSLLIICDPLSEGALLDTLNEDEIPALGPGIFTKNDGFVYGLDATPVEHLAFWMKDLVSNWAQRRPVGAGSEIRLAILSWPAEQGGQLATPEVLNYAETLGVQVVLQTELSAKAEADIFDFIYQAREKNANVIYTNARSFGLAALLNGLYNLGLRERFLVGAPAMVYDSDFYSYLAEPSYAQGLYLTSAWAWWSEDNPGSKWLSKNLSDADQTDWTFLQMAAAADLASHVLEDIILAKGPDGLASQNVADALDSLSNYAVLDGIFNVDYSARRRSLAELRIWEVGAEPGNLTALGNYIVVPDLSE